MSIPTAPEGYATVNPFIITRGAEDLTAFIVEVFGGTERLESPTVDDDGLLRFDARITLAAAQTELLLAAGVGHSIHLIARAAPSPAS